MNKERQEIIELRDGFQELVNFLNQLLTLDEREKAGEDVEKEGEQVIGTFLYKLILLQNKINKLNK